MTKHAGPECPRCHVSVDVEVEGARVYGSAETYTLRCHGEERTVSYPVGTPREVVIEQLREVMKQYPFAADHSFPPPTLTPPLDCPEGEHIDCPWCKNVRGKVPLCRRCYGAGRMAVKRTVQTVIEKTDRRYAVVGFAVTAVLPWSQVHDRVRKDFVDGQVAGDSDLTDALVKGARAGFAAAVAPTSAGPAKKSPVRNVRRGRFSRTCRPAPAQEESLPSGESSVELSCG